MHLLFIFNTWLGGVVCSAIALAIAGPIILVQINKGKSFLKKEAHELRQKAHDLSEKLHHANQQANQQNQSGQTRH